MILPEYLPPQRTLARSAAWLGLLSMLLGFSLAFADRYGLDRHELLAAHRNALLGVFWLVAVAWSMPMLRYGPAGQGRLALALVVANWFNCLIPFGRAFTEVDGRTFSGEPLNDAFFLALTFTVHLPALVGSIGWIDGFRGQR